MSTASASGPTTAVRGSGNMRTPVYLIAIASCLVLSWLFASRENWIGFALVLVGAVAYAMRLVTTSRRARRGPAAQCRKSTSIKRVWAPSQPRGTVLVSPWRFLATMHSAVSASTSAPSGCWLA